MNIIICTNLANGIGLQADFELLRDFLEELGHRVTAVQYNTPEPMGTSVADLGIFLEVIPQDKLHLANRWWLFANPEWTSAADERLIYKHVDKVFAKTQDAQAVLRDKFPSVHYVGFLTRDKLDGSVPRERKFLHVGGNSGMRNTSQVIDAWRSFRYYAGIPAEDAPLTIISNSVMVRHEPTPGITYHKRVTEEELCQLQNSHLFHLMPSAYEGFGHALHESLSCGAICITTDAPPMNEFGCQMLVRGDRTRRNNMATLHEVSPADIRDTVNTALNLTEENITRYRAQARTAFEESNAFFRMNMQRHLDAFKTPSVNKFPIALLGNHGVSFCTERDLAWTLGDMGHKVVPFQENEDTTDYILQECLRADVKLFIYVHTHGWETPGTFDMSALLQKLKTHNIVTVSFHLDRYRGLNQGDGREGRVGTHPFWTTDYVFTADGGNHQWFKSKGINHYWLPPGVVKKWCLPGTFREDLAVDVGFVGARGYHPEYPFRGELINFLEQTYGDRFRIFSGYREQNLNDLYASIKVVVGDSCFGGADYYWSDRVPETLGRGGFLVHPASQGLIIPGLVTYTPGDLNDLQHKIDYYLERPDLRQASKDVAQDWVRSNETYTNRMQHMLRVVGL